MKVVALGISDSKYKSDAERQKSQYRSYLVEIGDDRLFKYFQKRKRV